MTWMRTLICGFFEAPALLRAVSVQSAGSIHTTVYRKPTHTNKYLNFSSHHPLAHKIAVVRTFTVKNAM